MVACMLFIFMASMDNKKLFFFEFVKNIDRLFLKFGNVLVNRMYIRPNRVRGRFDRRYNNRG